MYVHINNNIYISMYMLATTCVYRIIVIMYMSVIINLHIMIIVIMMITIANIIKIGFMIHIQIYIAICIHVHREREIETEVLPITRLPVDSATMILLRSRDSSAWGSLDAWRSSLPSWQRRRRKQCILHLCDR